MSQKKTAPSIFGTMERAHKRKKKTESIRKVVRELLEQYLPELNKEPVTIEPAYYKRQLNIVITLLEQKFDTINELRLARNHLSRLINEGNQTGKWQLDVPAYIFRIQRERPLRTEKWFKRSKALNKWKKEWFTSLDKKSAVEVEPDIDLILGNTLISSALFGGLCIPEALIAVHEELLTNDKPLLLHDTTFFLNLVFDSPACAHNVRMEGDAKTLRRWYPDNVTLSWLHQLLSQRHHKRLSSKADTWTLIKCALDSINTQTKSEFSSLKKFTEAAIGVTENIEGVELSQAMIGYLIGKTSSSSLSTENFSSLVSENSFEPVTDKSILQTHIANTVKPSTRTKFNRPVNFEHLIQRIKLALHSKSRNSRQATPQAVVSALKDIELDSFPLAISVFIEWLIQLLNENKTVSTAKRYFYEIGALWFTATVNIDIEQLDAEDFESLYQSILDMKLSEYSRNYTSSRLNQFHLYLSRYHEMPPTQNCVESSSSIRPFVRAAFIPENAFIALLNSIPNLNETDRMTQALQCLYILAYRTGLRRGELLKLRLKDIEASVERWLFIRNNRYGKNKTSSALRKIPLSILLKPNEIKQFEDYLAYKKSIDDSTNSLLFSLDSGSTHPFDGNTISNIAKSLLSEIMGMPIVFHHFRHTALSTLQLLLSHNREVASNFVSYSSNQIDNIRTTLIGPSVRPVNKDVYWAIAGLAGHLTPETTFYNYLHFSDLIAGQQLRSAQHSLSANMVKAITGFSVQIISRHINACGLQPNNLGMNDFEGLLYKKLTKYVDTEKSPKAVMRQNDQTSVQAPANLYAPQKNTPEICWQALKETEKKATLAELVMRFNVNEEILQKWILNAQRLAQLTTSKSKPRLFSRYGSVQSSGLQLAPPKPQSEIELNDAVRAIESLRQLYKKEKSNEIKWCIDFALQTTNKSKSGINFSSPVDLKKFLSLMLQVFPIQRWQLTLYCLRNVPSDKLMTRWQASAQKIPISVDRAVVKNRNKYPYGKMHLRLRHPHEKDIKEKRNVNAYSTNTMTFVFHIIKIML